MKNHSPEIKDGVIPDESKGKRPQGNSDIGKKNSSILGKPAGILNKNG